MNTPRSLGHCLGRRRPGRSVVARAATALLVALWILLPSLAAASPPDPPWIQGIYDGGDFDDVVNHIALLAGTSDEGAARASAFDEQVRALTVAHPPKLVCPSHLALLDRSPPVL
jgi:hypothetical protein